MERLLIGNPRSLYIGENLDFFQIPRACMELSPEPIDWVISALPARETHEVLK